MIIVRIAAIGAAVCLCAAAQAASPSFDCAKAQSDAEALICQDEALATLDGRLADRLAAAQQSAEGRDTGAQEAVDELQASQRGWLAGRDDCGTAGTADDLRACVEFAYLRREGQLVARYGLEAPSAAATYECEGDPANAVVVSFYDTELPSARVGYGGEVATASLAPSGSGSRYEGDSGLSLWLKGNDMRFAWRGGEEMNCTTP